MSQESRVEQRDALMTALGMLVDPIRRLLFEDGESLSKIPFVESKFQIDFDEFCRQTRNFCQLETLFFQRQYDEVVRQSRRFVYLIQNVSIPASPLYLAWDTIRKDFDPFLKLTQAAIRDIPCHDLGIILPSESPYSTYIRLRAICAGATARLDFFDPYLDVSTFHRYLPYLPDGISVTVVTSSDVMALPPTVSPTSAKGLRRDRIVAVSELLAGQFPDRYEFRVSSEQHDRHIRIDDQILHLGGSSKDAAKADYFTISNLDPLQSNHTFLDGIITRATEWFGPVTRTHRRA